jgi:excisionase family DNA binding protein
VILPKSDRFLTPKQAATEAAVSESTIRRYIRKGALPVVRRGSGPRPRLLIRQSLIALLFHEADH